jgi:chemotaxis protein histidine kinase CheA
MTNTEYDQLKAALAKQPPEALAAFIADLATEHEPIYDAATMFAQRGDPKKLVRAIRQKISGLKREKRFYHYREARQMCSKLDDLLDRIEQDLVPLDPEQAIELLAAFIETDHSVMNRVDDSDGMSGGCYRRACELFAEASLAANKPPNAAAHFERLAQQNDYGVRDKLIDLAAKILNGDALQAQLTVWQKALKAIPAGEDDKHPRHSCKVRLQQLAKAAGEIELFTDLTMAGSTPNERPQSALEAAALYLDQGQAERALDWIPSQTDRYWSRQSSELKVRIYTALDDHPKVQELQLQQFQESPCAISAKRWLENFPKEEQDQRRAELLMLINQGDYNWQTKARLYIDWQNYATAAEIVECNASDAAQSDYYTQSEIAKALINDHPRAATLLLRSAVEQTLAEARTKNYPIAVNYIKQLIKSAERIEDWSPFTTHHDWFQNILQTHARKSSFMKKLKTAGIHG